MSWPRSPNPKKSGPEGLGPEGWGPKGPEGWRSKPTLAKPTLAKVEVLVCTSRFWFLEISCLGFWKLIVQVVLRCRGRVEKGGAPWTQEVGSKGGGSKGWGPKGGGPKISRFFFPLPPQNSFFSSPLGVLSWNLGGVL